MTVKITLAIAFLAALGGIVFLLARVQDAERRALVAEQAVRIQQTQAQEIESWSNALRDSLGQALKLMDPPEALELADSVHWTLVAEA